ASNRSRSHDATNTSTTASPTFRRSPLRRPPALVRHGRAGDVVHAEHLAHEDRHDGRGVAGAGAEVEIHARAHAALRGAPDVRPAEANGGDEKAGGGAHRARG